MSDFSTLPLKIEQLGVVTSTQDLMKARLLAGERVHGLVLRAEAQTLGRGRRTRDWQSAVGGSYQTLAVYLPGVTPLSKASASIAVGLAQTLPRYGVKVGIKWPNDLFYRQKKLAGVLLEYTRQHLLIGVGVNVNNEVPAGAVGLRGWDLAGVHAVVLEGMQVGLALFSSSALAEAYAPFDLLYAQEVEVVRGGEVISGIAQGISERGCLCVAAGVHQDGVKVNAEVLEVCQGHLVRFTLRESLQRHIKKTHNK